GMLGSITKLAGRIFTPWKALERRAGEHWYPFVRDVLMLAVVAALGVLSALVLLEPWVEAADPVASITIDGTEIPTGDPRPEPLVKLARKRLQSGVTLSGPDLTYQTTWAELGAEVSMESLGRILAGLAQKDSPAARYNRDESDTPGAIDIPLPVSLLSDAAVESLVSFKDTIDQSPVNARFNFTSGVVEPEQEGRSLDVYATLARLDHALAEGRTEVELAVEQVPAKVRKEKLEDIRVTEVVGFYETPYSRMRKDADRTHNVKLGASLLDGQVIMPGEVFSFNETLGDRSEARGFRYAPVIAGGVLVEGMGGGTCQVASTLYAAAFFAGLTIVERQPHSRPSSYIKLGLDATVSYPDLDIVLRNPLDFPVVIHYTVDDGTARAEIRGQERPFAITLLRKVVTKAPFPIRVVDDSRVPRGEEVITQLGVPGYTVRRYKVIERDKVGYRFQTMDKYPPTTQFVRKGIGDPGALKANPPKDAPKADTHKPYRASDYLRMVQGDGVWYESTHD
ncbi:MAG: VanW family protein, partial [Deltaproteobacteria bacterium]|nr:VanW family protein [Deltaproteobacteria bacterium]